MEDIRRLSEHWLFRDVGPEPMERLLSGAEHLTAPRGHTVYTPHRFRRCLGVLLQGRIRVSKDALVVSTLATGTVYAAPAMFPNR